MASGNVESLPQNIKKISLVFFTVLIIDFILNLLLGLVFRNPGGGGAEVIILLPAGWVTGFILWFIFIVVSVKKIKGDFIGKLTFPLLFGIILGYVLFTMPVYTFSLAIGIRNYF